MLAWKKMAGKFIKGEDNYKKLVGLCSGQLELKHALHFFCLLCIQKDAFELGTEVLLYLA